MVKRVLALSGGVGGAKLAHGLAQRLSPQDLAIVCNTADDFELHGLTICPDIDTVMYTLAARSHPEQGWGLRDESWRVMTTLAELGGETWFRLGDKDLATHLYRSHRLQAGATLTQITRELCRALDVKHELWPMSDEPVRTVVHTEGGHLSFQHYFVREQCKPAVTGFSFDGIAKAKPSRDLMESLASKDLRAVVICPSNPLISIDPMLSLNGVRAALRSCHAPVIAVSPIVGDRSLKGPTGKMLHELGLETTALTVARHYAEIIDGFVIDATDAPSMPLIRSLGLTVLATNTIMATFEQKVALAGEVIRFAAELG